jgi:hypothetical protein
MGGGNARPKLTDFLLRWTRKRQSGQEQLAIFRALAARQEGHPRVDHR